MINAKLISEIQNQITTTSVTISDRTNDVEEIQFEIRQLNAQLARLNKLKEDLEDIEDSSAALPLYTAQSSVSSGKIRHTSATVVQ
tara:strand:+ start:339 stop:596 length:258 start_codon:yes stop_codon:yes gene_type:complete